MSEIKTNKISSLTSSNSDITLDPDGTGNLIVESGNVGIGTTTPAQPLEISGTAPIIRLTDTGASNNYSEINADYTSGSLQISADTANASSNSRIMFAVDNTERMRIDSSGNVLVGTTSATAPNPGISLRPSGVIQMGNNNGVNGDDFIVFRRNGTNIGSITQNGTTAVAYNTSSDYRLKENVADMTGAIDRVKTLAPKRFNWVADDDDRTVDGFLAHEAQAVVPEAVTGTHNEVDEDGNPVMQAIDQSKLVPLLTGALREAIAKIEALEARVTALENA